MITVPSPIVIRFCSRIWVLVVLTALAAPASAVAQELECRIQIDDSQLSDPQSDLAFLSDLERKMQEYLNTRDWTDDQFLPHERISCSLQIVLLEQISISEFRARLVVTARRPIYGTSQSTVVTRINDPEWEFEHTRGSSLQHDLDRYNPLTSVLDFYAYLLLGYDYDTFSPLGGTPYFEQARAVADQAEGSGDPGWSSVGATQNRAQLLSDVLDQRQEPLRRVYYQYHRKVLDRFVRDPEVARKTALGVLETLQTLNRQASRSFALSVFFSTKYEELTALFADSDVQGRAHGLLVQMDPSHSSEYDTLVR